METPTQPGPLLAFHKIVDWDAAAGRFLYDEAYASKRSDRTYDT